MTAESCEAAIGHAAVSLIERVDCFSSFQETAARWLALESQGVATPYQRFDWVRAWCETAGAASGVEPMLVAASDKHGRSIAILPLGIRAKAGLRIASFLGDKHANLNFGLYDRAAAAQLTRDDVVDMLRQAGAARHVDLFMLRNQPRHFAGLDNPLALLPSQPSSSSCWGTPLEADGEALIRRLRSSESLKKLRAKARKLSETGPLTFVQPKVCDGIRTLLDTFFAQKAEQFRRMGVSDPYADPAIRQFLLRAMQGSDDRAPPVSLWALKAGDKVAAVFAGATQAGHRSGMIISYDADPAIARHSPGELLLQHVIKASCESGLTGFDLGTGDGPYKQDYCPVQTPLFDSVVPVSAQGRAAAFVISSALATRVAAKKLPLAVRTIDRLRKAKAALRGA